MPKKVNWPIRPNRLIPSFYFLIRFNIDDILTQSMFITFNLYAMSVV